MLYFVLNTFIFLFLVKMSRPLEVVELLKKEAETIDLKVSGSPAQVSNVK